MGKVCRSAAVLRNDLYNAINRGVQSAEFDETPYINNSIWFGAISINLFLFATIFLCVSFLKDFLPNCYLVFIIMVVAVAIILMDFFFIKKHLEKPISNFRPIE